CGNILAPVGPGEEALAERSAELARAVSEEFGLVGVNGVDFIDRGGMPHTIEVNPRWSSSMELVELAYGVSVFGAQGAACSAGHLPDFDLAEARRRGVAFGKAVVYARRDTRVGDTSAWLCADATGSRGVRDVPRPGELIPAGRPVCTVFATAHEAD